MEKLGIISQLSNNTLNYGNRLQAYALNNYLINNFECEATSLIIDFYEKQITFEKSPIWFIQRVVKKVKEKLNPVNEDFNDRFSLRLKNCQAFTNKTRTLNISNFGDLENVDFDILIAGSDVIWAQSDFGVDRVRFLDFYLSCHFKKISYAASFGENWIPTQNKKYVKKYLNDFDAISVREKSSIDLLESIDVKNVIHVCDPTLLLTADEWSSVAEPVQEINEKYIFVYLLGKDVSQREAINNLAKKYNLKIATIPHANNVYDSVDDNFGDYKLMDASPENWLWLIKNAEYVITDSFHGTVFSTIFSKNFLVTKRHYEQDINMRMTDYLDTIGEQDKFVDILSVDSLDDFVWDYEKIYKITDEFIEKSKEYLEKALTK